MLEGEKQKTLEDRINHVESLIYRRRELDRELSEILGFQEKEFLNRKKRKVNDCCGSKRGHRRWCTSTKDSEAVAEPEDDAFDKAMSEVAPPPEPKPKYPATASFTLLCQKCGHEFNYEGVLLDAICPECHSNRVYKKQPKIAT